jgi:hypothetical protein
MYLTLNFPLTFLNDGVISTPLKYNLIGITSPFYGHPSISSYFTNVSLSVYYADAYPYYSFRITANSIYLIFIFTK